MEGFSATKVKLGDFDVQTTLGTGKETAVSFALHNRILREGTVGQEQAD